MCDTPPNVCYNSIYLKKEILYRFRQSRCVLLCCYVRDIHKKCRLRQDSITSHPIIQIVPFLYRTPKLKSMILFTFNVITHKTTNSWVSCRVILISSLCEMTGNASIAIVNCYFMRFYQYILNSIATIYYCSHLGNIL